MTEPRASFSLLVTALALVACRAGGTREARSAAEARLSRRLEEIYLRDEFTPRAFGPARWIDAKHYLTVEASTTLGRGQDLVRYDAESGARSVLVPAGKLVPPGEVAPLSFEDYALSGDARKLLVFTNTRKVWRQNTRGDYWVLDLGSG